MIEQFVDAHIHLNSEPSKLMDMAEQYNASVVTINTDIPYFIELKKQKSIVYNLKKKYANNLQFITTFDNKYWNTKRWIEHAIEQIKEGLHNGAVGVKIWKNYGMDKQFRDANGNFVMIDNKRFDPIIEFLCQNNVLLIGHQGEPKNCWLPLEEMTVNNDKEYFSQFPEYHMFLHPEYPSYTDQIRARDNMLRKHRKLKYVGLHLFSLEWSLKEISKRLDRFPNTMIDLADRMSHIQWHSKIDHKSIRNFFIKYQDRIIYGTDTIEDDQIPYSEFTTKIKFTWEKHWEYFSEYKSLKTTEFDGKVYGLGLPPKVLQKIFYCNAINTYSFFK